MHAVVGGSSEGHPQILLLYLKSTEGQHWGAGGGGGGEGRPDAVVLK